MTKCLFGKFLLLRLSPWARKYAIIHKLYEKTHCRTMSILLYLCTFQLRNTGCLPLSASSTFVYTFITLPAFQRTDTNQYSKPWNKSLSRENRKPCYHNNVCCYMRITGKRKHHVQSRRRALIVVCITTHLQSSICPTAILHGVWRQCLSKWNGRWFVWTSSL